MKQPHVTSGGRYPALRTIAILYLVGALLLIVLGVWQAVSVFFGGNVLTLDLLGAPSTTGGKIIAAVVWLAVTFISVLGMFAIAELIKLFIDIEHNTRMLHQQAAAGAPVSEGPGLPFAPGRKVFGGDETAEGALLRGH